MKRKSFLLSIFFVLLMFVTFTIVNASTKESSKNEINKNYGKNYEKPIVLEDEVSVPEIPKKQWFEYVDYRIIPSQTYVEGNIKAMLFLPMDFSMSSVMEISPLLMKPSGSDEYLESTEDFSTASSIEVSYEKSCGYEYGVVENYESGFETGIDDFVKSVVKGTFSQTTIENWKYFDTVKITRTFDAIVENRVVKPWRIVEYKVMVPMLIRVYENNNLVYELYYLAYLMSGLCREWSDGYIEHWATGQRVLKSDFYGDFLDENQLIKILTR